MDLPSSHFAGAPSSRRLWALVFLAVLAVYAATATYGLRQSIDTFHTAVQGYVIATTGSPVVEQFEDLDRQVRDGRGGLVTDRHPGSVGVAVAAYWLAQPFLPPPDEVQRARDVPAWPAGVAAALIAAAAVAFLGMGLERLPGVDRSTSLGVVAVFALGTGTWSVSANALWPHTVTQAGIALGIVGLASSRPVRSGLGMALAVVARTHTSVIAAGAGLGLAWQRRRVSDVFVIGLVSAAGLALAVAYGMWVFGGGSSMTVGRGSGVDRIVVGAEPLPPLERVGNLALLVVHPVRGLLPMAPMLIPLLFTLPAAWRQAPWWVRGLAIGALLQLVVQGLINVYSGGDAFFGSRITLEFLTATAPLWAMAYEATRDRPRLREWTHVTAGAAIVVHATGATILRLGTFV